ncbi:MAG: hypothetical protein EPO42_13325 [Gallionellaceae bacterium]|nr:MAG: hypothetical protein EPO42_13325 [Gallionellaceae bacterium]
MLIKKHTLSRTVVVKTNKPPFSILLSDDDHGAVARLAVENGLMMDEAVRSIFSVGLAFVSVMEGDDSYV